MPVLQRLMFSLVLSALFVLLCHPLSAAANAPGALVSADWLKHNLGKADLLVIDASFPPVHKAGHIPGAVNVNIFGFGGREQSPAEMERLMQSWGIGSGKTVVLYDPGATYLATSLFFDLAYNGFPVAQLAVLDGGFAKWIASGGEVTKETTPAPIPGDFRVTQRREEWRTRLNDMLAASGNPAQHVILDALEPRYYYGASKFFDRAGHLPRAVSLPTADLFNADKTFKSPQELKRILALLGARPEQQLHSYCGGGIAASVPFFAAKFLAGYPHVALYKGSQHEWLRDDRGLPVWTYAEPQLLRDMTWLSGWNDEMMRQFGVARLNIVDVRGDTAYGQGHIPFALNLPIESLRDGWQEPQKFAQLLGSAGIDAAYETVVVAEGGLSARAALAFFALHAIGHPRVSILVDSVDDWGLAGHNIVKTPTAVGPKKHPMDPSIPPTRYVAQPHPSLFANIGEQPAGAFPRIVVATGPTPPAGKAIHLPASEFLATNAVPKPAKEIMTLLSKAGVTRYAEIVLVADDAGDAAIAYVIFKLMGYPDVKVGR